LLFLSPSLVVTGVVIWLPGILNIRDVTKMPDGNISVCRCHVNAGLPLMEGG
jgi:hypothetical protein